MESGLVKVVWKFFTEELGVQCVMTIGTSMMEM